jgi:uncharacterized protein YaiL (DUF2058 family)
MSLRDQLLKSGLASKKDKKRVERELKASRKKKQGERRKKKHVEREQKAAEQARVAEETARRLEERKRREAARDRYEEALRVRNLILGHRVKASGPHPFFARSRTSPTLHRLSLSAAVVRQIAQGRLAVAILDLGTREEPVVIQGHAAERIAELDPSVLVHHHTTPSDAPEDALAERDWEPDLRAHRG